MLKRLLKRIFGIKSEASIDVSAYAPESFNTVAHAQSIQVVEVEQKPDYPIPVEDVQDVEDPECRTHFVQCASTSGLHNMAYHEWGDPNNQHVLICVHGLTRRGSDFKVLAKAMSDRYRVICPDVVGRGDSDWLPNPMLYGIPQYVADMVTLIARLGVHKVDWFGTSMGGLIGIFLASQDHSPIRRMILNDVGPKIESAALKRLGDYVGKPLRFETKKEGLLYLNRICAPFGDFTPQQWKDYNGPHLKKEGGEWILHYDPNISKPFAAVTMATAVMGEMMTWKAYEAIQADMLVVRGGDSDLLSAKTVADMCHRNPRARSIEIPGVGHAPAFITPEQVSLAREFYS
jgi:cobalt-zinc-cadmium efflux system protein